VRGISDRVAVCLEEPPGRLDGYFAREIRAHPGEVDVDRADGRLRSVDHAGQLS